MATRPIVPAVRPVPRFDAIRRLGMAAAGFGAILVLAAACGEDVPEGGALVAEVGDHEITVEETANYMQRAGRGANREAVERAVDELVDLELIRQRARSTHAMTPSESLQVSEWREILLVNQLREDVVWKTVAVDSQRLRDWYEENVGEEVRVRHILIGAQQSAPEEERQAARRRADSLHQAIAGGADMAELAPQHSSDQGSAQQGGLLDWATRGRYVPAFEEAAFSTPVGELAPVVETQFGYHVLRVEDRRKPSFEDVRDEVEQQLLGPQRTEAEQAYVTRLMETSEVEFFEENVDRFIALVGEETPRELSSEEAALPLATYRGGEIRLEELYDIYRALPQSNQNQIRQLDQTAMIQALSSLVQQRLLLQQVEAEGVALDTTRQRQLDERIDQLFVEAYLRDAAQARVNVADSLVRQYYDEHQEFYSGQSFDAVEPQIRQVLMTQRMQSMNEPDAQRQLIEAVADTQAQSAGVEVYEDRFEAVLALLEEKYEESGGPAATPPATAPQEGVGTATTTPAPPAGAAPATGSDAP